MSAVVNLKTQIGSLLLANPTILASGIMDEDAGSIERMIKSGAAAVVTKSIGLHPHEGHPNPTLVELEHGLLNAMGLPNPGITEYCDELNPLITQSSTPIIASIYGKNETEFQQLAQQMTTVGIDALELNLSCPHAKHYGLEIGADPQQIEQITQAVTQSVDIPVWVKLSPNVTDIAKLALAAERGNAAAIVAINTVKAMKINLELKRPILSNKIGGYSGKAIKPIGIRCVYEIYDKVNIPIIGVGGITTGEDIIEYLMAGASAVQLGTGVYYRGCTIFTDICTELSTWMRDHEYASVSELIGVAHQ